MDDADVVLIAQLRATGHDPCVKLADYFERLLLDAAQRPDEARERILRMRAYLREGGANLADNGTDPLLEHIESCRGIGRSLLKDLREKPRGVP